MERKQSSVQKNIQRNESGRERMKVSKWERRDAGVAASEEWIG